MRYLILLFVFFLNCQDTKSKKTKEPPNSLVTAKVSNIPNKEKESETAFLLNDQNVMEFFLAYDKENKVRITTDFGVIDIELFEATKFHRSNFIYLTKKKYFNNTQFYRVIDNFIIQGGNSDDQKTLNKRKRIGRYLLPNDHKKNTNTIVGWSVCPAVQWPTLTKWPLLLNFLLYSSKEVLTISMVTMPYLEK